MLIDFTVENYRSIKGPVTLSAVASRRPAARPMGTSPAAQRRRLRVKPDDEIAMPYMVPGRDLELLPVLGLFGANASGKSNVLRALDYILGLMKRGHTDTSRERCTPFLLDDTARHSPTRFSLRTMFGGSIFRSTMVLDREKILEERLEYIPVSSRSNRPRLLFERTWESNRDAYRWRNGSDFTNSYRELQESLRAETPFTSILASGLQFPLLAAWSAWLIFQTDTLSFTSEREEADQAAASIDRDMGLARRVAALVHRFDTGIADIEASRSLIDHTWTTRVKHHTTSGTVTWPIENESAGTQQLFLIAVKLLKSFDRSTLLLIDELGANIHPNITRDIVSLFQNTETNPRRAQLIFTSHDNTLLRNDLLRRDQIWFTQKRRDDSTELYPLTDFRPRNDLALDRAYLDGRFDAIPFLPDTEELLPKLGHGDDRTDTEAESLAGTAGGR